MVSVATDRKLAMIVLAIIAATALIGFGNGLRSALAAPRAALPGETASALLASGASAPRDATAQATLDEARVHEIAREEADAALARARPAAPKKAKAAAAPAADQTPDQPIPYTPSSAADGAGPATPQNPPSNPDQG